MSETRHLTCSPTEGGHCSICGDEATLARVLAVDPVTGTAVVHHDGVSSVVATDLLEGLAVGATVLVHLGFAISRIEGEARA